MKDVDIEYFEDTDDARGVSKKDQLTYRTTLQRVAEICLKTQYTKAIKTNIIAFTTALYFDIPGLPFQSRIDKFEKELDEMMDIYDKIEIPKYTDNIYYHPKKLDDLTDMHKDLYKNRRFYAYYHTKLRFLMSLLAEHDALMKAKGMVEEGMDTSIDKKSKASS